MRHGNHERRSQALDVMGGTTQLLHVAPQQSGGRQAQGQSSCFGKQHERTLRVTSVGGELERPRAAGLVGGIDVRRHGTVGFAQPRPFVAARPARIAIQCQSWVSSLRGGRRRTAD